MSKSLSKLKAERRFLNIMDEFRSNPRITITRLSKLFWLSRPTIRKYMNMGVEMGLLKSEKVSYRNVTEKTVYSYTPKMDEYLKENGRMLI